MGNPSAQDWSISLNPHRSLSRQGFLIVMACLIATNLVAGSFFLLIGAWPIFGFMGLDVLLVWWAFRRNFADSERTEQIIASGGTLTLHRLAKTTSPQTTVFNRSWVRVELEYDAARDVVGRLYLRSHGKLHEIASFLGAEERQSLARALQKAL